MLLSFSKCFHFVMILMAEDFFYKLTHSRVATIILICLQMIEIYLMFPVE